MSSDPPVRPDRQALLELDALPGHIIRLREAGSRSRYDADDDNRWAIHRVWIAIGNEALAFADAAGLNPRHVVSRGQLHRALGDTDASIEM